MIWMILVTQKDCAKEFVAQIRTLEKDQRPLAPHESPPNRRTTNLVSRDACTLSYLW